jgi:hypothetical protein
MPKRRLRLPSPALVIALIALTLVLGGTAVAASTAKPLNKKSVTKLVKKLAPKLSVKHAKSANSAAAAVSATHATSADSATSATTAASATGLAGPLASGQTERGVFGLAGHETTAGDFVSETGITFPIPLAAAPAFNVVVGATPTTKCPGTLANPTATAGQLCLYTSIDNNVTGLNDDTLEKFGVSVFPTGVAAGNYEVTGSWAVTAP